MDAAVEECVVDCTEYEEGWVMDCTVHACVRDMTEGGCILNWAVQSCVPDCSEDEVDDDGCTASATASSTLSSFSHKFAVATKQRKFILLLILR